MNPPFSNDPSFTQPSLIMLASGKRHLFAEAQLAGNFVKLSSLLDPNMSKRCESLAKYIRFWSNLIWKDDSSTLFPQKTYTNENPP